jgi:hypothetical protein
VPTAVPATISTSHKVAPGVWKPPPRARGGGALRVDVAAGRGAVVDGAGDGSMVSGARVAGPDGEVSRVRLTDADDVVSGTRLADFDGVVSGARLADPDGDGTEPEPCGFGSNRALLGDVVVLGDVAVRTGTGRCDPIPDVGPDVGRLGGYGDGSSARAEGGTASSTASDVIISTVSTRRCAGARRHAATAMASPDYPTRARDVRTDTRDALTR